MVLNKWRAIVFFQSAQKIINHGRRNIQIRQIEVVELLKPNLGQVVHGHVCDGEVLV